MTQPAIRVENIGKQYQLGLREEGYKTLRESITNFAKAPLTRFRHLAGRGNDAERFWALRNVSFEVQPGEVVGIIGANGAGKSTLLKVLCRVTEPTEGRIENSGRVGSLLEVGTGFHPELTGRENIFLNGAVLGMKRTEVKRKFDEIVAFAEVEKFIDTPVKRYSSGMYLRLAFAVAAHLEPEILLVDEVLAVGDLRFQRKCLGKMGQVAEQGRTVLFVSHNLGAIKELCQSSIVLQRGGLAFRGSAMEGVAEYTRDMVQIESASNDSNILGLFSIKINGCKHWGDMRIGNDTPLSIEALLETPGPIYGARIHCIVFSSSGECVVHRFVESRDLRPDGIQPGRYRVGVEFPALWLSPDAYTIHIKLIGRAADETTVKYVSERVIANITNSSGQVGGKARATLMPQAQWTLDLQSTYAVSREVRRNG